MEVDTQFWCSSSGFSDGGKLIPTSFSGSYFLVGREIMISYSRLSILSQRRDDFEEIKVLEIMNFRSRGVAEEVFISHSGLFYSIY